MGYIKNMLRKKEDEFELAEGTFLSDLPNKLAGIYGDALAQLLLFFKVM